MGTYRSAEPTNINEREREREREGNAINNPKIK
jgi:hypothetical protein